MDTMQESELEYEPMAQIIIQENGVLKKVFPSYIEHTIERKDRLVRDVTKYLSQIESVREYLIENYDELDEHAKEIADLLDVELTREVEVTITYEVYATVTLGVGEELDDVVCNLDLYARDTDNITIDGQEMTDWSEN